MKRFDPKLEKITPHIAAVRDSEEGWYDPGSRKMPLEIGSPPQLTPFFWSLCAAG